MLVKLRKQIMLARQAEKQDKARQRKENGAHTGDEAGRGTRAKPLFRGLRYALSRRTRGRPFK